MPAIFGGVNTLMTFRKTSANATTMAAITAAAAVRRILRSCGDRMPSIFSFASATPVTSSFFRISCRFPRSVAVARFMLVALLNGSSPPIAIASAFSSGFVIW